MENDLKLINEFAVKHSLSEEHQKNLHQAHHAMEFANNKILRSVVKIAIEKFNSTEVINNPLILAYFIKEMMDLLKNISKVSEDDVLKIVGDLYAE